MRYGMRWRDSFLERLDGRDCGSSMGVGGSRRRGGGPGKSRDEAGGERPSGGPFGRGGFGGFGRGRGGGGGGRVFGSGDLRFVILALVAEKPSHGYELIKAIEQKFGGGYTPSPGSVYPTLTLLEELGQVRSIAEEGAKRLFEITAEGRAFLAENQVTVDGVMARMAVAARAMSGSAAPAAIYQAMHTLKTALAFHRGGWSAEETLRVAKIIEQAADTISTGKSHG